MPTFERWGRREPRALLRRLFCAVFATATLTWCLQAGAHKSSDAYLQLTADADATRLRVDIALRDLDVALDLDADGDGRLTWGEIRAAWPGIEGYVRSRVQVAGCPLGPAARALERRIDGVYAALTFQSDCRLSRMPAIRYTVMSEVDPTHRGIARLQIGGAAPVLRVLDPTHPQQADPTLAAASTASDAAGNPPHAVDAAAASGASAAASAAPATPEPAAETPAPRPFGQFLREGVHHILSGYDHILFLLCLLLPAVLQRTAAGWRPVGRLREAVLPVAGIVTAFTLAHSITLGLAASKLISLSPAFIEPAIAVTIMLAALDNLVPVFRGRRALVTFAFGLIHGFGFAGVLAELDLPTAAFAWALLQFNLGIELGQLTIVAIAVTVLYAIRSSRHYVAWVLRGGSVAALIVALAWFIERTANVSLMPF